MLVEVVFLDRLVEVVVGGGSRSCYGGIYGGGSVYGVRDCGRVSAGGNRGSWPLGGGGGGSRQCLWWYFRWWCLWWS